MMHNMYTPFPFQPFPPYPFQPFPPPQTMSSPLLEITPIAGIPDKKHPRRIRSEGVAILEDFNRKHHTEPDKHQVQSLLAEIHAIPGCEDYKASNLRAWFRRRHRRNETNSVATVMPISGGNGQQAHVTLADDVTQHLRVLAQGDSSPSPAVVATWAILLKVPEDDINAWLAMYRPLHTEEIDVKPNFSHLPTPISISPEPARNEGSVSGVVSSVKTERVPSPVVSTAECEIIDTPHPHISEGGEYQSKSLRVVLARAMTDIAPVPPVFQSPVNPAEFVAMFEPYKQKLEYIWQALELEKSSGDVPPVFVDPL